MSGKDYRMAMVSVVDAENDPRHFSILEGA
jgi:hypothetical protein